MKRAFFQHRIHQEQLSNLLQLALYVCKLVNHCDEVMWEYIQIFVIAFLPLFGSDNFGEYLILYLTTVGIVLLHFAPMCFNGFVCLEPA